MLELDGLIGQLALRPAVFWVGAGILAAGVSCLAASLVMLLRRRRSTARRDWCGGGHGKTAGDPPAAATTVLPAGVSERRSFPGSLAESSSALLLRRLRLAGDRLDEIAGDLETLPGLNAESGLKGRGSDVEYVFKATGG